MTSPRQVQYFQTVLARKEMNTAKGSNSKVETITIVLEILKKSLFPVNVGNRDFVFVNLLSEESQLNLADDVDSAAPIRKIACDVITTLNRWLVLLPPVVSWGPVYPRVYRS
ncbi:hypothetical protein Enr17x_55740 [Gimesia fumaroli]|uniref:Uncharacterized protein n=1 Tax=Gimesia fumaroli TaxID=2527976 RepID=A0A518IKC1_9PLAN|nr:hypothetical protein Enr17x_55740 [Gimesia fumaroli]